MFEELKGLKLTNRGRTVVAILQAAGTITVMGFCLASAAAFLILLAP